MISREALRLVVREISPTEYCGRVTEVCGPTIKAELLGVAVGDLAQVALRKKRGTGNDPQQLSPTLLTQVVGYRGSEVTLSPFGSTSDIVPGAKVTSNGRKAEIHIGEHMLGSVVDALGQALDTNASFPKSAGELSSLHAPIPEPLTRAPISRIFQTGIKAIDAFCTLGCGQRIALFAEPGVGKSTLISQIAASSSADVNVIGLIGERGRELAEFVLGLPPEVRKKTIIVASTSDEPAVKRAAAALTATRIAEYFRDQGKDVLLEIDSLTRLFRAYREIGLAAGEVPVRRGYPPSVFSRLPELIERAGTAERGTITAIYTVLLSSDLDEDPMVEEVKGITDGHIMLRRTIAEQGRYPAIDILSSISRLASKLISKASLAEALKVRSTVSAISSEKEMLLLSSGSQERLKLISATEKRIANFLGQGEGEPQCLEQTLGELSALATSCELQG